MDGRVTYSDAPRELRIKRTYTIELTPLKGRNKISLFLVAKKLKDIYHKSIRVT